MNPIRKAAVGAAMVSAALGGGALGAFLVNGTSGAVSTQTSPSTTAPNSQAQNPTTTAPDNDGDRSGPGHGPGQGGHQANGITESLLTGDTATKVRDAATAAVPGATVQRLENDAEGSSYEAHMVKPDGSRVTVKVDSSFKVTAIESGRC